MAEDISVDSVESYIQHLQGYGTRSYNEPNRKEIAEWIAEKFTSLGIVDVKIDSKGLMIESRRNTPQIFDTFDLNFNCPLNIAKLCSCAIS